MKLMREKEDISSNLKGFFIKTIKLVKTRLRSEEMKVSKNTKIKTKIMRNDAINNYLA
jgi:hypothetical protein